MEYIDHRNGHSITVVVASNNSICENYVMHAHI